MTLLSIPSAPVGPRYTPELAAPVLEAIRAHGLSLERAAALHRLPADTVRHWQRTEAEFRLSVAQAEAELMRDLLLELRDDEEADARRLFWLLERRFPEDFSTRRETAAAPPVQEGVMDAAALRLLQEGL